MIKFKSSGNGMRKAGRIFFIFGIAAFLFLSVSSAFLHNHKADPYTHYNCPAYLISIALVSLAAATVILLKRNFPRPCNAAVPENINLYSSEFTRLLKNKSPPF